MLGFIYAGTILAIGFLCARRASARRTFRVCSRGSDGMGGSLGGRGRGIAGALGLL